MQWAFWHLFWTTTVMIKTSYVRINKGKGVTTNQFVKGKMIISIEMDQFYGSNSLLQI